MSWTTSLMVVVLVAAHVIAVESALNCFTCNSNRNGACGSEFSEEDEDEVVAQQGRSVRQRVQRGRGRGSGATGRGGGRGSGATGTERAAGSSARTRTRRWRSRDGACGKEFKEDTPTCPGSICVKAHTKDNGQ